MAVVYAHTRNCFVNTRIPNQIQTHTHTHTKRIRTRILHTRRQPRSTPIQRRRRRFVAAALYLSLVLSVLRFGSRRARPREGSIQFSVRIAQYLCCVRCRACVVVVSPPSPSRCSVDVTLPPSPPPQTPPSLFCRPSGRLLLLLWFVVIRLVCVCVRVCSSLVGSLCARICWRYRNLSTCRGYRIESSRTAELFVRGRAVGRRNVFCDALIV